MNFDVKSELEQVKQFARTWNREYTLQPDTVGVNCWLLRRDSPTAPWRVFRVINT